MPLALPLSWPPLRAWLATLMMLAAANAQAFCGFFAGKADASLFNEASQVILVRDGERTVISMLNDYRGPLADFALVVPVPQVLQRDQVRIGDARLFARLDAYSAPRLAEYFDPDPCPVERYAAHEMLRMDLARPAAAPAPAPQGAARAKALGVAVEAAYTVGEYDIVMLSARQSHGLATWLRENGYRMPAGAADILKPYVAQGMKFFVAKVNLQAQAATGTRMLRPLQFAFNSEKFMLPLRLGMVNAAPGQPQDLIVYALTRGGRVESSNYRTVKLPANVNLPVGVKRDFKGFYKALFDHQAQQEAHRVVFTEYFWDMAWCDPCAADPLSPAELRDAGVFWLEGEAGAADGPATGAGVAPGGRRMAPRPPGMPWPGAGGVEARLTRLHVRYTRETFPEDLMFTHTGDRQNWQTRYVLQHPFPGTLAQCREKAANLDCTLHCSGQGGCIEACRAQVQRGVEQARRYYLDSLPQRQRQEAETLARLTGWPLAQARRVAGLDETTAPATTPAPRPADTDRWWQRLFGTAASAPQPGAAP